MTEARAERRARARALAHFFTAGAVLSTTAVVLPGWDELQAGPIAGTIVAAGTTAALLYSSGEHVRPWMMHTITALGTVLIGFCQVYAGGGAATATYAMLYVWVILHCALFFPRAVVIAHLGGTVLAHVLAVIILGEHATLAPQLALTVGTQLVAAFVVGSLASSQRQLADTDALTGLGNRRVADRALAWAVERARRERIPCCVAVLDLDGFKAYNDAHGHAAGDAALVEVAQGWRDRLRAGDVLARTGGDEFLLVLTGQNAEGARATVVRLLEHTAADLTCSVGLARWVPDERPADVLARADEALYEAKRVGADAVVVSPEPSDAAVVQAS